MSNPVAVLDEFFDLEGWSPPMDNAPPELAAAWERVVQAWREVKERLEKAEKTITILSPTQVRENLLE